MIKLQSTSRFKPDSQSRLFIDARNPNMHHVYPTSSIKRQYVAAIVANLPCGKSCTHDTLDGVKLFILYTGTARLLHTKPKDERKCIIFTLSAQRK